jgi:hypothetical protein
MSVAFSFARTRPVTFGTRDAEWRLVALYCHGYPGLERQSPRLCAFLAIVTGRSCWWPVPLCRFHLSANGSPNGNHVDKLRGYRERRHLPSREEQKPRLVALCDYCHSCRFLRHRVENHSRRCLVEAHAHRGISDGRTHILRSACRRSGLDPSQGTLRISAGGWLSF